MENLMKRGLDLFCFWCFFYELRLFFGRDEFLSFSALFRGKNKKKEAGATSFYMLHTRNVVSKLHSESRKFFGGLHFFHVGEVLLLNFMCSMYTSKNA